MRNIPVILLALLITFTVPVSAQWLGTVSIESGYDDNIFRNYTAAEASATDLTLEYGYFPDHGIWAINYTGAMTTFSQYPDRLYSTQTLGSSWVHKYGENKAASLSALAIASARFGKELYSIYDYRQMLASVSIKQPVAGDIPLLVSYRARYRSYPEFGELSYLEHFASVGSMVFFETRTSIRMQADLGFKNYLRTAPGNGSNIMQPGSTPLPPAKIDTDGRVTDGQPADGIDGMRTFSGGGGGNGNGGGWNEGGVNGRGAGRMSLGNRGPGAGMDGSVEYLLYEEPSTSQLSTWINIGQGITDHTGVSLRYLRRWNLTDRGRAFVGGAVDFIGEEELFDDPYSYESDEVSLTLTQVLPWSMRLRLGAFYMDKTYGYPATFDYEDPSAVDRSDERLGGWIGVSKSLAGDWLAFSGLNLSLGYVWLRNKSNTSYYDYSSNAVNFGISTDF
ncbi:MAG: DUF560 domain-containing protein [Bacteroidetes bacterium]|nr:DUF560 domain-containing protein [Bacteroidota bacterium]